MQNPSTQFVTNPSRPTTYTSTPTKYSRFRRDGTTSKHEQRFRQTEAELRPRIDGIVEPIHALVLIAMGMPIFDNLDLEAVSREAAKRNRWDFLVTAAPAAIPDATGSQLNPVATF